MNSLDREIHYVGADTGHGGSEQRQVESRSAFIEQLRSSTELAKQRDIIEQSKDAVAPQSDRVQIEPLKLVAQAQAEGRELVTLLRSGKKTDDVVQYRDEQGHLKETTLSERVEALRLACDQNCQNAITSSNELIKNTPDLQDKIDSVSARLQNWENKLGLEKCSPEFKYQIERNPELRALCDEQTTLQAIRMAPATAMMTYALLKKDGLTESPQESFDSFQKTGVTKPTDRELADAFLLISQAGRTNSEVFHSPAYAAVSDAIKTDYAVSQNEKGKKIIELLKEGEGYSRNGDSSKAEESYKSAWQIGETIDQKFLAAQLRLPDNRSNPEVAQVLLGVLADVKEARMHYAGYLVKEGKFADALPIALSIRSDTPEFAKADSTYDSLVSGAQKGMTDVDLLISDATFGKRMTATDLQMRQYEFCNLMQDSNNPNRFSEAQQKIDDMLKNFQDAKSSIESVKPKLESTISEITNKQSELDKKKDTLAPEEYKIEQKRLNDEKNVVEAVQKENEQFLKQGSYLKYLQGTLAYAREDTATAHALFEEVKKDDPELAANKELKIDELCNATAPAKKQNWFQRHWHAIASAGAVIAGVVVGVAAGMLTGPGGIAAGAGTTAAIMTAIGAGVVGGAAGGAVFVGTKAAALGKDSVKPKDFLEGALLGAAAAVPAIRAGAAFAPGAASMETLESTAATGSSKLAQWLAKAGITKTSAAFGVGFSGLNQSVEVGLGGKSAKDGAIDFAKGIPEQMFAFGAAGQCTRAASILGTDLFFNLTTPSFELGAGIYADHKKLPPPSAAEIAGRYSAINPSVFRPEDLSNSPQPAGVEQKSVQLSEQELESRRNEKIEDK